MSLSLKEARAVSGLAGVLYDFLPGSGRSMWKGHVTFSTVATKVGLGHFWTGGSKRPAIHSLLSETLKHKRGLFEPLVVEIVRSGISYREKQGKPISVAELDSLNGHIYEIGFKFPALWDPGFRNSLQNTTAENARNGMKADSPFGRIANVSATLSDDLHILKERFSALTADSDRQRAGLAFEILLNRLFTIYGLNPRRPFRVVGEQIDGSFDLDAQIYLVEAKWEKDPLPVAPMLVFRGKIEGKSTFTRGLFIALNGVSDDARHAITQGKSPSFFVMNGYDIFMILSETISLVDFLRRRVRLLAEEGRVCASFSDVN